MLRLAIFWMICSALVGTAASAPAPPPPVEKHLEACGTVALPGVEGRLDHFAVDPKTQRLFVAGLGNNSLEIVGIREGRRLQSISGMKKPTGVVYLPRRNSVCVANSEDGTLRIHDAGNYQPKQIIHGLENADNLRYDPITELVYVGYGNGGIAVVDSGEGQVVGMIKLKAHPEAFQLDAPKHTLYVNLPEAKQIAVVDLNKRDVMGSWPMEKFPAVFPMALDEIDHRLLVGCRRPARLVVLDTQSGKTLSDLPIGGEVDDLFFDARRKRLYAICGEGEIDLFEQVDADHYRPLEKVTTAPGARTGLFSTELDVLAVAVPRRGNQQAEIRLYQPR